MPSLSELRAELKEMRKQSLGHAPVSRMRKGDISAQIEHLKRMRGETPAAAAVPSAPAAKSRAAVESIKEAKKHEFPVMPAAKAAPKAASKTTSKATSKVSKAELRKMLEELSSDEE